MKKNEKKAPYMTKIENNAYFGMRNPNFIVDFPENAIFRKIDLMFPNLVYDHSANTEPGEGVSMPTEPMGTKLWGDNCANKIRD